MALPRRFLLAGAGLWLALACGDDPPLEPGAQCVSGTCVRIATETPTFDPATSLTHFPNRQHTPRTFTDFAWDVEDEAHVSPETYSRTGDFFIQSTNTAFAAFFTREFGFIPQYFLRFAGGVSLEPVDEDDLSDLERFNIVLEAPGDEAFDTRFGFPLDDAFRGKSLFFRTLNQQDPRLPRFCVLTLERSAITPLADGNQRVEADLRYHCAPAPGDRGITLF